MLLTRQKPKAPSPTLNMTPMIDIIFQLLVFFMCTATFSVENVLRTQLPSDAQAEGPDEESFPPIRIRLRKVPDGVVVTCDGERCENYDEVVGRLKAFHDKVSKEMRVIIEGEGDVAFGYMARALDACHQAGLRNVAFSPRGTSP